MSLTVHRVADWAGITLGNEGEHPLSIVDIANQAGEHLVNAHPWRWLSVRRVPLDLRASYSFAGATTNGGTAAQRGRIISSDDIIGYTHVPGDIVNITGGTVTNDPLKPVTVGEFPMVP